MSAAVQQLVQQHKDCDVHLSACESALIAKKPAEAKAHFDAFRRETEAHFELEEKRLFPAFEQATGMSCGPTSMMRQEHGDLRQLFDQLAAAIDGGQPQGALDVIDTLNVMLAQHNVKEENVLYPMCAETVGDLERIVRGD